MTSDVLDTVRVSEGRKHWSGRKIVRILAAGQEFYECAAVPCSTPCFLSGKQYFVLNNTLLSAKT